MSWRIAGAYLESCNCEAICPCRMAMTLRYDDDERGSPWRFVLYVDQGGDDAQRSALEEIMLGRRGGPHILKLPWVRKPSEALAVRPALIELADDGKMLRVGERASLRVSRRADQDHTVACGIPGYDCGGAEYFADELRVDDEPYAWELQGNCAFATRFDYASE